MAKLKPCPFCGGTNIHVEYEIDDFGNEIDHRIAIGYGMQRV